MTVRRQTSQARRKGIGPSEGSKNVALRQLSRSKFCLQTDEELVMQGVEWLENIYCIFI
jgi:hypothetical protein